MLENSNSSENTPAPVQDRPVEDGGGSGPDSDGLQGQRGLADQEADRNSARHRWPREETLALLKIRSEMDIAFRDISPKGPLWQQVSRRLAELGYHRSAKKCKEKFENIYKYHRRTKEGRYGRPNRKTYRFFEQLEALDANLLLPPPPTAAEEDHAPNTTTSLDVVHHAMPCSARFPTANSDDSITSFSNEESPKQKSKLPKFFQGLMKQVIEKQEALQKNFMEVLEKCEQDRIAREEAWRTRELARLNKERELLAQERSAAAAKDAALIAFLKKITEQSPSPVQLPENIPADQNLIPDDIDKNEQEKVNGGCTVSVTDKQECGNNVGNFIQTSSSRWPKEEVEDLIRLRTNMDAEYEGGNNGTKGPLWEEISSAMKKIGYDRSAKRCKEKWENINKYFKRMKQKNKRKPEDSKTCPYFHQLEELYRKKPRKVQGSGASGDELKAEELLMHIMSGQEERQSSEDTGREKTNQIEGEDVDQMVDNSNSTGIMG